MKIPAEVKAQRVTVVLKADYASRSAAETASRKAARRVSKAKQIHEPMNNGAIKLHYGTESKAPA